MIKRTGHTPRTWNKLRKHVKRSQLRQARKEAERARKEGEGGVRNGQG